MELLTLGNYHLESQKYLSSYMMIVCVIQRMH
jgi:hypothetical protein